MKCHIEQEFDHYVITLPPFAMGAEQARRLADLLDEIGCEDESAVIRAEVGTEQSRCWLVRMKHDGGSFLISTWAKDADTAKRIVCEAEGAPLSAAIEVEPG